jgi:hypothetical protein
MSSCKHYKIAMRLKFMNKVFTVTVILILAFSRAFAQDSLKNFNYSRNQITTSGMEVLGSWAIVNIGVGAAGWANSAGGSNKYFYQMNVLWNTVNLGAAILGFTGAQNNKNKQLSPAESLRAQQKIEQTFLINGGLDIIYIGSGLYLHHRGDSRNSDQLRGYGSSIILQGAFLLLFDGTMYNAQRRNGGKLRRFFEKNPVTFDGGRVGIIYNM